MVKQSKLLGIKMSARTRKLSGSEGIKSLETRRSGLAKILGLFSKATGGAVSNHPRAVEYTAAQFNL